MAGATRNRGVLFLGALVLLVQVPLVHQLFWGADGHGTVPYSDDFERDRLGEDYTWFFEAARPRIQEGRLYSGSLRNNPVWLTVPLPHDVSISFEVEATGREGDVKVEAFGNGRDHESGYIFIFGGWNNTLSVLARLDEHGEDRKVRKDKKVELGRRYQMRIERRGQRISWYVDGELLLDWDDPEVLTGTGHDRFGFSAWESPAVFDNLRIEAL